MPEPKTESESDAWQDLITAMLAVNNYSLEKTFAVVAAFRREGLIDPNNLARWSEEEVVQRFKAAGYDRGAYLNKLFALRLCSLGVAACDDGLAHYRQLIEGTDKRAIRDLLSSVRGIGPRVLQNFMILRGL
jgi:endonuclease III-like uncharacterized protein